MERLILASGNAGKIAELRALLRTLPLQLVSPAELGLEDRIPETGGDYASNAQLKARAMAQRSGGWALADDSGLEVDALDGAPGLHSARLAGPGGTDADRRAHLLALLRPHPRPWTARFRCTLALAHPRHGVELAEGVCEGEVLPHERGSGGFGYDPLFLVDGTTSTMAELPMEAKNVLSHRAAAVRTLLPVLREHMGLDTEGGRIDRS
jgi:XTP/dITP diphosphohydrolase